MKTTSVTAYLADACWGQNITCGLHQWRADQPVSAGGADTGPDPHALLASALVACTGMTVWMYAQRKAWPLEDVRTEVSITHEADATRIDRKVTFVGPLDTEQRARLAGIADKCPIHKLLTGTVTIQTTVVAP